MKRKLSSAQHKLLEKLYVERGKILNDNAKVWLDNLPFDEASKYIDIWISKNRNKRIYGDKKKYNKPLN